MLLMSPAALAMARSSALSLIIPAYSITLAEVGVTSMSCSRYALVSSWYTPAFSISRATVTPSMGRE